MMADNSAALRRARRQDGAAKRRHAAETIEALERSGEPISFPAIARRAGVSVSLLYSDSELAGRITAARDRQRQAGHDRAWKLPARSLITEQSLHTELANSKEQTRQLTKEVGLLRERLARQLGADADLARGHAIRPTLDRRSTSSKTAPPSSRPITTRYATASPDSREISPT